MSDKIEPPCDCIVKDDDDGLYWMPDGCECGNYDDCRWAGNWCGEQNEKTRSLDEIESLRTEVGRLDDRMMYARTCIELRKDDNEDETCCGCGVKVDDADHNEGCWINELLGLLKAKERGDG